MRLPPPPLVALGAGVAQRIVIRHPERPGTGRVGGAAAIAAGSVAFAVTAATSFRRAGTTLDPGDPGEASVLVTSGPHALSRNPMYLGLTGVLVANAVRLRSWAALLPVAVFVVVMDRLQVPAEEAALRERFGADYEAYSADVPRWLGTRSLPFATPG